MMSQIQAAFSVSSHYAIDPDSLERVRRFRSAQRLRLGPNDEVPDLDVLTQDRPDDTVVSIYAKRAGSIIAAANMHFFLFAQIPATLERLYNITPLTQVISKEQIAVISGMTVDPAFNDTDAELQLLTALHQLGLCASVSVSFAISDLDRLSLYLSLGFQQYRSGVRTDGRGLRIPLILSARDTGRLAAIDSPLARVTEEDANPRLGQTVTHVINRVYGLPNGTGPNAVAGKRHGWLGLPLSPLEVPGTI